MKFSIRLVWGALLAALLTVALAPTAGAHVTVSAAGAEPGKPAVIDVRVPTESDTASTVRVELRVPQDIPVPAQISAPDGWRVEHAGNTVTWSAEGTGAAPHQTVHFTLNVASLPRGIAYFPALQTYSDGTVVSWTERGAPGLSLEHPAPSLAVGVPAPSAGDEHHGAAPSSAAPTAASSPSVAPTVSPAASTVAASNSNSGRLGWIVAGIVVVVALGAVVVVRRRRS